MPHSSLKQRTNPKLLLENLSRNTEVAVGIASMKCSEINIIKITKLFLDKMIYLAFTIYNIQLQFHPVRQIRRLKSQTALRK